MLKICAIIVSLSSYLVATNQGCSTLISDFSQDTCIAKSEGNEDSFYFDLDEGSCIPKCKSYKEAIKKECSSDTQQCMPGYSCEKRCGPDDKLKEIPCQTDSDCNGDNNDQGSAICDLYCVAENKESCMAYHINSDDYKHTYWSALRFKPSCNNDGTWKAKQCKGGIDGRCLCFDSQGNRLFGEALSEDAANMTCACSRRQADLETTRHPTFHCDSMGNYEPLQCDIESRQCWCVEPQTGELVSPVVPEKAISLLSCFSVERYGVQYLRQCESKKFAQAMITHKLKTHGVTYVSEDFLLCERDGSYGAFMIEKDNAYCTWRDQSKIGAWQANIQSGFSDLNCKCARDYYKYGHSQTCLSTGNYKPLQHDVTNWYCVDEDGFSKTGILTDLDSTVGDTFCLQFY